MEKDYIFTDLAIEASEMVHEKENVEIDGVKVVEKYEKEYYSKVTTVEIETENGSLVMGKPIGKYITIESDAIEENDIEKHKKISQLLSKELNEIISLKKQKSNLSILLVGLGNSNVFADSLGPKVINDIIITRHLFLYMPDELDKNIFGNVSAIVPGVMGNTGMESSEIVKGIVDKTKPDLVIVIDSLAARRTNRLNKTIQITNTGINPGSGVGNTRKVLNKENLKTDVIAIGVPTVVNAYTLINDICININNCKSDDKIEYNKCYDKYLNLCVTPKEEDIIIERIKSIVTNGLNLYLHKGLDIDDIKNFVY